MWIGSYVEREAIMMYFIYDREYNAGPGFYPDPATWEKAVDEYDFFGKHVMMAGQKK